MPASNVASSLPRGAFLEVMSAVGIPERRARSSAPASGRSDATSTMSPARRSPSSARWSITAWRLEPPPLARTAIRARVTRRLTTRRALPPAATRRAAFPRLRRGRSPPRGGGRDHEQPSAAECRSRRDVTVPIADVEAARQVQPVKPCRALEQLGARLATCARPREVRVVRAGERVEQGGAFVREELEEPEVHGAVLLRVTIPRAIPDWLVQTMEGMPSAASTRRASAAPGSSSSWSGSFM